MTNIIKVIADLRQTVPEDLLNRFDSRVLGALYHIDSMNEDDVKRRISVITDNSFLD